MTFPFLWTQRNWVLVGLDNDLTPITSNPYAVLPLFAASCAACTGGIWVTAIEPYLILSDIKLFVWDIWPVHLVRLNLLTCFSCFCNLEFPDISFADLLRFEYITSLFSCLCISMLTPNFSGNMQKHGYLGCFHAASARRNISWVLVIQDHAIIRSDGNIVSATRNRANDIEDNLITFSFEKIHLKNRYWNDGFLNSPLMVLITRWSIINIPKPVSNSREDNPSII